jgi:hypothetical protein
MNIIDAFRQLGSYRAAARLCGTTDKTVKRAVERQRVGAPWIASRSSRTAMFTCASGGSSVRGPPETG